MLVLDAPDPESALFGEKERSYSTVRAAQCRQVPETNVADGACWEPKMMDILSPCPAHDLYEMRVVSPI